MLFMVKIKTMIALNKSTQFNGRVDISYRTDHTLLNLTIQLWSMKEFKDRLHYNAYESKNYSFFIYLKTLQDKNIL